MKNIAIGLVLYTKSSLRYFLNIFSEDVKEEPESCEESEETEPKPVLRVKKSKSKPDMAIRRKQLKAKSKSISDQIKKRKQFKRKKLVK